ncbi:hypothetical protein SAMN04487898_102257 [Pedobacter sp. ok626]|uniref:hypothetical protein n=1 Tax=Pedobacter sp. ok626 TaxID=1761882 RepID=UPI0008858266|nr:hypothetical protein [Pedobacter sp. ok626]SDJ32012.1 hypothetical protein SAMN04487898_102257 [Pedobacter sp. ok626]
MKNLSLNIKKIGLGLMVAFLAIGFSAFKIAQESKALQPGSTFSISDDFLVQRTVGELEPVNPGSPTEEPNPFFCETETSSFACSYQVTAAGKANIRPLTPMAPVYTTAEINSFLSASPNPYIVAVGTTGSIYAD